jgi:beta-glucanase (GH16 family)
MTARPGIAGMLIDGRLGIEVGALDEPNAAAGPAFVDAMKAAPPWRGSGALRTDAWGNVTQLEPGTSAQTVVLGAGTYPAGDYALTYDGRGAIDIDGATVLGRVPGRIVLRVAPLSAGVRLKLTATDPDDYVRNLHLIARPYAGAPSSTPFFPAYVAALRHVNVVRFAGWMRADRSTAALNWAGRTTPGALTQTGAGGVAPEYMIALANATGDDPWFVFPAGVSDEYVAQFAQLVRATLDPRLHPIFEYGDAMLEPGTAGWRFAALAGLAGGGFSTSASPAAATAWYAHRSAQVFALVTAAFGLESGRIRRVLAGPPIVPGTLAGALSQQLLASPAARLADAFAVADAGTPRTSLSSTAASVRRAGLTLWSYDAQLAPALNAVAEPAGRSLYDALFADWHAAGGGLAVTSSWGPAAKWAALRDAAARYPAPHLFPQAPAWQPPIVRTIVAPAGLGRLAARPPAAGLPPGTDVIAIDCGGPASGNWVADTDYSSPSQGYVASGTVATNGILDPAPQTVYQSQRWTAGSLTYTIPGLTPGAAYTVRLHWAETYVTGPGQRTFNVSLNGSQVLTNFDVFATAGGSYAALVENFYATANTAGQIVIAFTGVIGDPFISGIEIQIPGPIDALDINAGGAATGNWLADMDFSGGTAYAESTTPVTTTKVTNPAPQAVYQSERFNAGALSYAITGLTANAAYALRLHFAELSATAKGQRVFDVVANGTQLLTGFDIFAKAGGAFNALGPSFAVNADATGQIAITLNPVVGDPQINGIEIEALPVVDAAAVNAGGGPVGVWSANTDAPQLIATTSASVGTAGVSSPAPQAVYESQRFMNAGALVYQIPGLTPNASYAVRLHFAELNATGPGQRVVDVGINDAPVLANFDIYAATGGQNIAAVETFNATANSNGQIMVGLTPVAGNPALNGIEVVANAVPSPRPKATPTPATLCIGGSAYAPTQDDEFSRDKTVRYSPNLIQATPQPNGAIWSSRAWDFADDGARNNIGTDDAYYTDPTRGLGPYTPFSLGNGALTITAVPVPQAYATAAPLDGAHWLSGLLESPTQTYGYIEVSAAVPNTQGEFSAPLWLLGPFGSDGNGNGYEEIDVNEMFGTEAPSNVLFQTEHTIAPAPGSPTVVNHVPVEVEMNQGTAFHTYGVLWTPSVVRFYVDRQPTAPDYPNGANGPMHAIINLGVFTEDTWAPGPPNGNPLTMSLQYYRWYQTSGSSCSPSQMPS